MSIVNTSQSKKLMSLIPAIIFLVASWPSNAQAATAPSCVKLTDWKVVISGGADRKYAKATNDCTGSQRFRMIWAWAADGPCYTIPKGGTFTEYRRIGFPPAPYVSELKKC
jgi:hypothetical protein